MYVCMYVYTYVYIHICTCICMQERYHMLTWANTFSTALGMILLSQFCYNFEFIYNSEMLCTAIKCSKPHYSQWVSYINMQSTSHVHKVCIIKGKFGNKPSLLLLNNNACVLWGIGLHISIQKCNVKAKILLTRILFSIFFWSECM